MNDSNEETIYKITIERTRMEKTLKQREWVEGGPDEVNNNGYGYTPQIVEIKSINREIYSQSITNLDVAAVVAVVNRVENHLPPLELRDA